MSFYQWQGNTLMLKCRLQPKSSKDEIMGEYGDDLKVRITAPPIDGKANSHLIKFLAKQFKVPQSRVEIVSGLTGRQKRISIKNPLQIPAILDLA